MKKINYTLIEAYSQTPSQYPSNSIPPANTSYSIIPSQYPSQYPNNSQTPSQYPKNSLTPSQYPNYSQTPSANPNENILLNSSFKESDSNGNVKNWTLISLNGNGGSANKFTSSDSSTGWCSFNSFPQNSYIIGIQRISSLLYKNTLPTGIYEFSVNASSRNGYQINPIQVLPWNLIIRPNIKCNESPGSSTSKYIINNCNNDSNLLFQGMNSNDSTTFLYEPKLISVNLIKNYVFTTTNYDYASYIYNNTTLNDWTAPMSDGIIVLNPNYLATWGNYNPYPYRTQNILGIQNTGSITTNNPLNLSSGIYNLSFYAIKRVGGMSTNPYGPNGIKITLTSTTNTTNTTNTTINANDIKDFWKNITWDITITSPDTYKLKIEGITSDKTTFIQGVYIIKV